MMKPRITCAGDCGVDAYVNDKTRWTGGCTLNVGTNLAGLIARESREIRPEVAIVTAIGDDWDSRDVKDQIFDVLPSSKIQQLQGASPTQLIELMPDGERRFRGYQEGVLGAWQLDRGQKDLLAVSDLVMAPLFSQFEDAFLQIAASCVPERLVVDFMDLTDFAANDPLVQRLARSAHTGFFGLDAEGGGKFEAVRALSRTGPGTFVVTLGQSGSLILQDGEIRHRCPAVPVYGAVNTTGAGDAFAAAFMLASLRYGTSMFALQSAAEHAASVISGANKVARFIGGS